MHKLYLSAHPLSLQFSSFLQSILHVPSKGVNVDLHPVHLSNASAQFSATQLLSFLQSTTQTPPFTENPESALHSVHSVYASVQVEVLQRGSFVQSTTQLPSLGEYASLHKVHYLCLSKHPLSCLQFSSTLQS